MLQVRRSRPTRLQAPMETYLSEINETALLSAEEEHDLANRVADGDPEARDHLVRANLRLVVNIARGYGGRGLSLEDLIAEGNLGLLRAAEGFDATVGTRFSTYAAYWIKQSIKRAVINTGKTIRLPSYMVELLRKWSTTATRLKEELGRPPLEEEIAARLGLKKRKLAIIKRALRVYNAGLLAGEANEDQGLEEMAIDGNTAMPDLGLARAEELHQVLHLLDRLEAREAQVLRLRFGLGGEDPLTLMEIGRRLGLTRERVRQIEKEGLNQLRAALEDEEAGQPL